jgi:hypothetical protein
MLTQHIQARCTSKTWSEHKFFWATAHTPDLADTVKYYIVWATEIQINFRCQFGFQMKDLIAGCHQVRKKNWNFVNKNSVRKTKVAYKEINQHNILPNTLTAFETSQGLWYNVMEQIQSLFL